MNTKYNKPKIEQLKTIKNKTKAVYEKCCENLAKFQIGFFEALAMIK